MNDTTQLHPRCKISVFFIFSAFNMGWVIWYKNIILGVGEIHSKVKPIIKQ